MREIKGKDFTESVQRVIVFKYLKPEQVAKIISLSRFYSYGRGEKIIAKGELSPDLCAVIGGTVHVVVPEAKSGSVFISSIGEGDVFGEAGIFMNVKRTADVVSADEAIVLKIGRRELIGFVKAHPEEGIKILMLIIYSLLKKLKEANIELAFERMGDISQGDIDAIVGEAMRD